MKDVVKRNARLQRWRKKHPVDVAIRRFNQDIKRIYGLMPVQYAELEYRQKGRCAICGYLPEKHKLSVDHDHATGKVRGLLCGICNASLEWMIRYEAVAKDYLK